MDDHINNLYETDFVVWINTQADLLRAKHFDQLDLENLVEELEGMASKKKLQLEHRLDILLMHLLKRKYQPEHISASWIGTIHEQRRRIARLLKAAPSIASHVDEYLPDAYPYAAKRAAYETGLPLTTFPATSPFTKEQLLDQDYIP